MKPLHFPDMTAYTDKLIGKVVAKLEELHLRDNTLLLILGDNGTGRGTPSKFQGRNMRWRQGHDDHLGHARPAHRQLARPLCERKSFCRLD